MANVITLNTLLVVCCIFTSVHYAKFLSAANIRVTIYHSESGSLIRATPCHDQVMADGITGGQYH